MFSVTIFFSSFRVTNLKIMWYSNNYSDTSKKFIVDWKLKLEVVFKLLNQCYVQHRVGIMFDSLVIREL